MNNSLIDLTIEQVDLSDVVMSKNNSKSHGH
ncbi:hypothetical protein EB18_01530 [Enterococcus cecorum]|uniref:Uncharacterized protein n=1 Tax=Enterococcus cecorum TaxID=44008 RepID=A0A366SF73_9ENTE|nr:hypothetical protein EB18_01530 [Enterococcus cecorum]